MSRPLILLGFLSDKVECRLLELDPSLRTQSVVLDHWWPKGREEIKNIENVNLSEVTVYFGSVNALPSLIQLLPNLKWIQTPEAGVDVICDLKKAGKIPDNVMITRNGGTFSRPISQYVIGQIISSSMKFIRHYRNQQDAFWDRSEAAAEEKPLSSCTVAVLGLGQIGGEIAKACKYWNMTVWALTRSEVKDEKRLQYVDEIRQSDDLVEVLSKCDYLVNILPSTSATRRLLDGDILANCTDRKPVFINVGRGDVISDDSLIKALRYGWISKAVLDVFSMEPLPDTSPLWGESNVIITPHIAHGCSSVKSFDKLADMFCENYRRFINGEVLSNIVVTDRGY